MNSNPIQAEAICHNEGPMLVLAGPGSGKTYVITNRVRHLIEHHSVRPEQILVITFSKAAAREMKNRFGVLTAEAYPSVTFGTFHAVFFHMLQYAYNYKVTDILKESDAISIVCGILGETRPDYAEDRELVRDIYEELLRVKGSGVGSTSVELSEYKPLSCDKATFVRVYRQYNAELRARRKVDFEDMLLLTHELLSRDKTVLAYWQSRYRYLLIDEFQDINRLQYKIVQLLAGPTGNVFAVGDDDQSIYAFRGSAPSLMLSFPNDFPGCKMLQLPINYRSTPEIIRAASSLISVNADRYEKTYTPEHASGEAVRILRYDSIAKENEFLISEINALKNSGCPDYEIAILYRTNLQMRSLCSALSKAGISYRIRGFVPCLYENTYVHVVLSYLRAANGDTGRATLLAIANQPKRYIERRMLTASPVSLDSMKQQALKEGKEYLANNIDRLQYDLSMLSKMNPFAAIHYVRNVIGYDKHIAENCLRSEETLEVLEELSEAASEFPTVPLFLAEVEKAIAESKEHPARDDDDTDGIQLLTLHASKGLEYNHVYICDCNETLIPHKKALFPASIEEERRLFYVGLTRARRKLTLTYVAKRFGHELKPSRFLGEILMPIDDLRPGVSVVHRQFGPGVITSVKGDRMEIRFEQFRLPKTLSRSYCIESMVLTVVNNE